MGRRCYCSFCGEEFKFKKDKKEHRLKYLNGSCVKLKEKNEAIELIDKKLENMHKYAGSKGILLELKQELKGGLKMEEKEEAEEIVEEETKEAIKEITKIQMPKEQAKEEWKKYVDVLKKRKDNYLKVMKQAMYHMKEGRGIIDIYKVIKKAGLNENNEPKLAIARADLNRVTFEKSDEGAGSFEMGNSWKDHVSLPQKTFSIHWERDTEDGKEITWRIKAKRLRTKVPIVPVEILPDGDLKNYYILWETDEWEELPETKDPILLKRISENLFAILGTWDLTELEQSIIAGGK